MINYILELPDGTRIRSGAGESNAIESVTLTKSVNSGTELTLGSVCCTALEISIISTGTPLLIEAGSEVILYENDTEKITQSQVGIFTVEKPTKASANRYKVTGYDRVSRLDKDVSAWLQGLTGWPYTIRELSNMVCTECGVVLKNSIATNADFSVPACPTTATVTGRQLMQWIAEIAGYFVTADAYGLLAFGWYNHTGLSIEPSGENYFYEGSLTYEDYTVAQVDAVKVRLADSEDGMLWPEEIEASNLYIVTGNKIIETAVTSGMYSVLNNMIFALKEVNYRPCKVTVPMSTQVKPGDIVTITDKNGVTFTTAIMTTVQTGQKIECESVGGAKRENSESANNPTESDLKEYADNAVRSQTSEDVFNRLTENGKKKGLFMQDGEVYVNASYIKTGELLADLIKTGAIQPNDISGDYVKFDLDNGTIESHTDDADGNGTPVKAEMTAGRFEIRNSQTNDVYYEQFVSSDGPELSLRFPGEYYLTAGVTAVGGAINIRNYKTGYGLTLAVDEDGVKLTGLTEPFLDEDAANKKYVDKSVKDIEDSTYPGCYYWDTNGKKEWVNPPMEINTEYRTTERYKGKPVYVTKLYIGSLPQGTNSIDHGLGISQSEIVRFDGLAVNTTSYNYYRLPMISSAGNISATARVQANKADIICFSDLAQYAGYVTIWYLRN